MATFFITRKFSKDIKVDKFSEPPTVLDSFDGWFIDIFRVQRKKIAIATHATTYLTFFLPYCDIGGAVSVPDCVGVLVAQLLYDQECTRHADNVQNMFENKHIFCKTNNRKVLGHMNDFKYGVEAMTMYLDFPDIDWDEIIEKVNKTLINTKVEGYETPQTLFSRLLG